MKDMCRFGFIGSFAVVAMVVLGGCLPEKPVKMIASPAKAMMEARITVSASLADDDSVVRARAVEAVALFMGSGSHGLLLQALDDKKSQSVRIAAALAIGDLRYAPASKRLIEMISNDEKLGERYIRVLPSVIYALDRLGHKGFKKALGTLLTSPELGIRANTAIVMGKIGDQAAIAPLKDVHYTEQDIGVKLALEEALASLGDAAAIGRLEGYARGRYVDIKIVACMAMSRYSPLRAKRILRSFFYDENTSPPVKLIAAAELGRLGVANRKMYDYCLSCAFDGKEILSDAYTPASQRVTDQSRFIQMQGVLALGWMGQEQAVDLLLPQLKSPNHAIRIAAATSILRLLDKLPAASLPDKPMPKKIDPPSNKTDGENGIFIEEAPKKPKLRRSGIDD